MAEKTMKKDLLTRGELSAFCAQISMILKSGIPLAEGLSMMCADMRNVQGKQILESLYKQVDLGKAFYKAISESGKFPKYMVDMCEIGETAGKLDDVMDSLCTYYEREQAISRNIKNAVTYPLIMLVMMIAVIGVLIVEVLPIFNSVFEQLGGELTDFSRSIMNFGIMLSHHSVIIIIAVLVLVAVCIVLAVSKSGRALVQKCSDRFFITRNLKAKISSGRFASAMSLMMASGLDVGHSLDMVGKLLNSGRIKEKIEDCKQQISSGMSFSDALVKADIFPGVNARMVSVGFKTGSADTVMKKLAERYEEEVELNIGNIISVIEPTLVAVLSIVVGMILLSVMLPLMGIMSSIG